MAWVTHWSVTSVSPLTAQRSSSGRPSSQSNIHFLRIDTSFPRLGALALASAYGIFLVDAGLKLPLTSHSWHSFTGGDQVGSSNLKEKAPHATLSLPKDIVTPFQEWETSARQQPQAMPYCAATHKSW